jgi:hypothetical protein|tara:strand:- start:424 stop:729 length:306 start_codon:yes stop_codon:yes gene_type:complete
LIALDGLVATKGVGALWCKHEGFRFGIGSFKPTGPTYAMLTVLKGEVQKATGLQNVDTRDIVVTAATERATDPEVYRAIVGREADEVMAIGSIGNHEGCRT